MRVGHQAHLERRPAPEVRRCHRRAGQDAGRDAARSRPEMECRARPPRLQPDRLGRILARDQRRRPVQQGAPGHAREGARRRRLGARSRAGPRLPPRERRSAKPPDRRPRRQTRRNRHRRRTRARRNGRCGKCSSAASRGWSTSIAAACTPPDAEQALHMARDVYTRRQEGVSHLGGALGRHHAPARRRTRPSCSSRRPTRSTGTRRSTSSPTKSTTCKAGTMTQTLVADDRALDSSHDLARTARCSTCCGWPTTR